MFRKKKDDLSHVFKNLKKKKQILGLQSERSLKVSAWNLYKGVPQTGIRPHSYQKMKWEMLQVIEHLTPRETSEMTQQNNP